MNDEGRNRRRTGLYALVGIYLLYVAYNLFKNRAENSGTEAVALMVIMAAFVVIGVGLLILGGKAMSKSRREEPKEPDEEQDFSDEQE